MADYSKTLNLPKTDFSMRASLPQREPSMLSDGKKRDLYAALRKKNAGKPKFILHDGPPFSNGNIHMGTSMNKVLKDFIVKYKNMTGFDAPYVPGWDNHGMPIESAIIKKNKIDRKTMSVPDFREACRKFAEDFVNIQRDQFIRLGVLGDWEHPYLTMDPKFEAEEVKVFGEMYKKGYIYKGLKPVYWCPTDETALAEAEIEYKDVPCRTIYVKFRLSDDQGKLKGVCDLDKTCVIIWTTTAWTLPGNLAIALNPDESYAVTKAGENYYITAAALAEKTMKAGGIEDFNTVATFPGKFFEFMKARHPFLDRESVLLNADYVTNDSGTGCVHTAPAFGVDDYNTCRRYGIEGPVPVDDRGIQTADAGKFAGMFYEKSSEAIIEDLKESGALFAYEDTVHSYPHCWRCKKPIIFRATPQWFCSVDAFRKAATDACRTVEWLPAWGEERIIQMVNERSDWCISRQRRWGLPIPVFYCEDCGKPVCDDTTTKCVSALFGREGSNAWYLHEASEILPKGYKCPHCGGVRFTKENDTLDGWFDSGSTHAAVIKNDPDLAHPADLYLEGADQYRGWFQSSLLTSVAVFGYAPFKQVLTHGWTVDGEGKAMHKSLGNAIAPEEIISKYGADLLRMWVASSDYRVDVRVSDAIFAQLSETYRKIRNTARILLANLSGFDPDAMFPTDALEDIDKWLLSELNSLVKIVNEAYQNYEFHVVYHEINDFCTVQLSKLYIDITKDRLYAEGENSPRRRSAQAVMYKALDTLIKLLAPILAYTCEEIWEFMPHRSGEKIESPLLCDMPQFDEAMSYSEEAAKYNALFACRDDVLKALETARADKIIGKSLDADIVIEATGDDYTALAACGDKLAEIMIVSRAKLVKGEGNENAVSVEVTPASGHKCDRCWTFTDDGVETEDGGWLCERCRKAI